MKVIDKETKEIVDLNVHETGDFRKQINSIADLTSKYEDYEEPKGIRSISTSYGDKRITIEFSTIEETAEAYEKLTAWKRLEDKGFRLNHWKEAQLRPNMSCVAITGNMKVDEEAKSDLDLLFSVEDD